MPLVTCPICDGDDLRGVDELADGRLVVRCLDCDHEWTRGDSRAKTPPPVAATYESLKIAFPTATAVSPQTRDRVAGLITAFLQRSPDLDPRVPPYRSRYQQLFSAEGLAEADPEQLKSFANNAIIANPGNMSVFNQAWNDMGAEKAASRLRATIDYLLRGPEGTRLEDRFSDLVEERKGLGMTGFKESLLTRVLCVVEPARFLPILKYTTPSGGKQEIAAAVFGLQLPPREKVSWTIGRLVTWSNDLLVELLEDRFDDLSHASDFLWWAKDQPAGASST